MRSNCKPLQRERNQMFPFVRSGFMSGVSTDCVAAFVASHNVANEPLCLPGVHKCAHVGQPCSGERCISATGTTCTCRSWEGSKVLYWHTLLRLSSRASWAAMQFFLHDAETRRCSSQAPSYYLWQLAAPSPGKFSPMDAKCIDLNTLLRYCWKVRFLGVAIMDWVILAVSLAESTSVAFYAIIHCASNWEFPLQGSNLWSVNRVLFYCIIYYAVTTVDW